MGHNEFFDKDNRLVLFDNEHQFMRKIMSYDEDIENIVDRLFNNMKLDNIIHDQHFKKTFFFRFINREINRQTIESFMLELTATFLTNQEYINRIYTDIEKYILGYSETNQDNSQDSNDLKTSNSTGNTTTDNRQARSDLPQSNINLDVNNTIMNSANENDISRNKQNNTQNNKDESESHSSGVNNSISKTYQLDQLFKTNNVLERIMNEFDKKCFLQFW